MSIERDQDFEQLEDIAAMMAENPGIEFENGKYVYYGLDGRTAFAAVYISGAWAGWQAAKAQVVQNTNHVIKALEYHLSINLDSDREDDGHSYWSGYNVALGEVESVMIETQVSNHAPQFNLDEFLVMEEKLKSKGGVIAADLDRFIAYAEMVLGKAKTQAAPDTYTPIVLALEDVQSKIAQASFLTMDAENESEVYAVDANEISAYIDGLIEAQESK